VGSEETSSRGIEREAARENSHWKSAGPVPGKLRHQVGEDPARAARTVRRGGVPARPQWRAEERHETGQEKRHAGSRRGSKAKGMPGGGRPAVGSGRRGWQHNGYGGSTPSERARAQTGVGDRKRRGEAGRHASEGKNGGKSRTQAKRGQKTGGKTRVRVRGEARPCEGGAGRARAPRRRSKGEDGAKRRPARRGADGERRRRRRKDQRRTRKKANRRSNEG